MRIAGYFDSMSYNYRTNTQAFDRLKISLTIEAYFTGESVF